MHSPHQENTNEYQRSNMRKYTGNLDSVKQLISDMQGKEIEVEINRGRNKRVKLNAIIDEIYPSMFVIKPIEKIFLDRFSYSYSDVLCGDIRLLCDN